MWMWMVNTVIKFHYSVRYAMRCCSFVSFTSGIVLFCRLLLTCLLPFLSTLRVHTDTCKSTKRASKSVAGSVEIFEMEENSNGDREWCAKMGEVEMRCVYFVIIMMIWQDDDDNDDDYFSNNDISKKYPHGVHTQHLNRLWLYAACFMASYKFMLWFKFCLFYFNTFLIVFAFIESFPPLFVCFVLSSSPVNFRSSRSVVRTFMQPVDSV